jgi:hypothetical protein
MATTTPNFGWPVPTSTDLVKDGAVAIEGLGDAIDASLLDLKGGTTGQVLAKASNTDMDFSWVVQDDANAIQNTQLTAKGALISAVSAGTPATLTVGTNGQVLTADSTTATGLAWAAAASGGGMTLLSTTTASGASTTVSSISGSYKELKIFLLGIAYNSNDNFFFRPNGNSSITSYSGVNYTPAAISTMNGDMNVGANVTAGLALRSICITIDNYANTSHYKSFLSYGIVNAGDRPALIGGSIGTTAAITSFTIIVPSGSFSGGTILVYGVN